MTKICRPISFGKFTCIPFESKNPDTSPSGPKLNCRIVPVTVNGGASGATTPVRRPDASGPQDTLGGGGPGRRRTRGGGGAFGSGGGGAGARSGGGGGAGSCAIAWGPGVACCGS